LLPGFDPNCDLVADNVIDMQDLKALADSWLTDGNRSEDYYYHYDSLGSVIALSNGTGNLVEEYHYDVYGSPDNVSNVGNQYLYTGRRYEPETALYYYRARYYSASIGRFLQTDLIGYAVNSNLYTYCLNSPSNLIDPYGLCPEVESWWEKIIPDAITISLSGAGFTQWIVGGGGGVEAVYIFGKGWVIYGQVGGGGGVPGGGGALEIGPIWGIEVPEDYTRHYIEIQGGVSPGSASVFFWPGSPGGFKVGLYGGTPGGAVMYEYYFIIADFTK